MSDQPQYPSYPGSDGPQGHQPPAYGQPAYGQPAYGQQPPAYGPPPRTNGKALWGMIAGIVSLVFCYVGLLIGPVAIVLSILGKKDIARSNGTQTGSGMATAGLVTGIVGTAVWAVLIALLVGLGLSEG